MELELTQVDQARLIDTKHNIQSANEILAAVDPRKIPDLAGIRKCLQDADRTIRETLRGLRGRVSRRS